MIEGTYAQELLIKFKKKDSHISTSPLDLGKFAKVIGLDLCSVMKIILRVNIVISMNSTVQSGRYIGASMICITTIIMR